MTPAGISVAPHGKGFYVTVALFASLFGFAFVWGAFAQRSFGGVSLNTPTVWRLVQAGIAVIFLTGAMQAFERWLAPAKAQARSETISDVARARLLGLRSVLLAIGVAGYVIYFVAHLAGKSVSDVMFLSGVFSFAGAALADLCGERR